jgi:nitrite reductase/ring-hydroxylating ferredoxin subunit
MLRKLHRVVANRQTLRGYCPAHCAQFTVRTGQQQRTQCSAAGIASVIAPLWFAIAIRASASSLGKTYPVAAKAGLCSSTANRRAAGRTTAARR